MSALTVQEKIILHLSQYTNYGGKVVVPSSITQEGIADAVGVQRPHISVDIKRMIKKGLVEEFKAHAGGRKKRKAYYLTSEGIRRYMGLIEELKKRKVRVNIGDELEMNGLEAANYLSSRLGLPYAMAAEIVMEAQNIDKELIYRKKEKAEKEIYSSPIPQFPELLGRHEEMERIDRWYKSKSTCLSVIGTAGIGKSALISSFVSKLRSPVFWHDIGEWEQVKSIFFELGDFLSKNGRLSLKNYLSSSDLDLGMAGRILHNIDDRQIWVFDDYQKASDSVRKMFDMLMKALKGTPIRLIVISRSIPDFYSRKDVSIKKDVYELFLNGLPPEAARDLLVRKAIYPGEEKFWELYSFTAGHPLALELIATSGMKTTGAKTYITEEIYYRLKLAERRMLSQISVYRRHIEAPAIVKVDKDVETLKSLLKKGLIYYDTEEKYFTHDLIKSFIIERGPQRREHMIAYRYYIDKDDIENKIEAVYHALMANKDDKAAELSMEILDEVIVKGRANELLSTLNTKPSEAYGILFSKSKALQATGNLKEAERIAKKLIRESKGDDKVRAKALLSMIYTSSGEMEKAIETLESALNATDSEDLIAEMKYDLAMAYFRKGLYDMAEKYLLEAMEFYLKNKDIVNENRIKAQYASVIAAKGEGETAVKILRNLAEFFRERGDYRILGNIYNNLGKYEAALGKRVEAILDLEKAALYGDLSGHMQLLAYALMNSANNYLVLGEIEKSLSMAEKAKRVMENIDDRRGLAILKTVIAEAHDIMGDDAEKYYKDAEKALLKLNLKKQLAELYMERGDIAKDEERSMEYYRKAMEIFKELGLEYGIKAIKERTNGKIS